MEKQKRVLITGVGGFIGSHLVKRFKKEGHWVRGVDLKYPEFSETDINDFIIGDLRDQLICRQKGICFQLRNMISINYTPIQLF